MSRKFPFGWSIVTGETGQQFPSGAQKNVRTRVPVRLPTAASRWPPDAPLVSSASSIWGRVQCREGRRALRSRGGPRLGAISRLRSSGETTSGDVMGGRCRLGVSLQRPSCLLPCALTGVHGTSPEWKQSLEILRGGRIFPEFLRMVASPRFTITCSRHRVPRAAPCTRELRSARLPLRTRHSLIFLLNFFFLLLNVGHDPAN